MGVSVESPAKEEDQSAKENWKRSAEADMSTWEKSTQVWACNVCSSLNYAYRDTCRKCDEDEQLKKAREMARAAERSEEGRWSSASGMTDENRRAAPTQAVQAATREHDMRELSLIHI